jgi:lysozyme family protein
MQANFPTILSAVLALEGGFSDNPVDPGGITNLGVTARTWASYIGVDVANVSESVIRSLTVADVEHLYHDMFWNPIQGDALPSGIDAMVFHMQVNAGKVGVKILQQYLGLTPVDGQLGPKTLAALKISLTQTNIITSILVLGYRQDTYYRSLPGFPTFGKGWLNRVYTMRTLAIRLANGVVPPTSDKALA